MSFIQVTKKEDRKACIRSAAFMLGWALLTTSSPTHFSAAPTRGILPYIL